MKVQHPAAPQLFPNQKQKPESIMNSGFFVTFNFRILPVHRTLTYVHSISNCHLWDDAHYNRALLFIRA
jgi:hypothetical protein